MRLKKGVVFFILLNPLWASEPPPMALSLNDAILLSLRYSPFVKSAEIQRVVDKFNLAVARNQFEMQYALTGSANQTNAVVGGTPLTIDGNYNLTPAISRQTVYGTQYNLSMSNPVTFNKTPGLHSKYYNPSLTLQVVQPLLQGSGREVVEANFRQAVNTEINTEIAYKSAVMDKVTQVMEGYRNLVSANNSLRVAKEALEASRVTVKNNAAQIRLGFMAPSENTQALSFVASQELQVTSAEYTVLLSKLTLLRDIGLSPKTPITVDNAIAVKKQNYPQGKEAERILFSNNPAYLMAVYNLKNSKLALLQAEDQQRWFLNATGTIVQGGGIGGDGNSGLPSLYNGLNRSRSIGLQLTVPIDDLPRQQQLVSAKVAYTQQELALRDLRINMEATLLSTLENLRVLYMQVEIAQKAQELSYKSYQDALTKVRFGQSSMFEVTTLQSTYINDQITTINTQISYLNGVAEYQRFLGITLDEWNIRLTY